MLTPHISLVHFAAFCHSWIDLKWLTTFPYPFFFLSFLILCYTATANLSKVAAMVSTKLWSEFMPNKLDAWKKLEKKKSCLMQNKCNNHGSRVQVEYTRLNAGLCFKGCFVHYKICKLYTFRAKSFKKCVSCIVCFAFFFSLKWRFDDDKKNDQSCMVAVILRDPVQWQ